MKKKIIEILCIPVVFSILATIFILFILSLGACGCQKRPMMPVISPNTTITDALVYTKANKMDTTVCILVDFSEPAHYQRMKLIDMQSRTILSKAVVSHGMGNDPFHRKPRFSNVPESKLSSLGKYMIGERGYSQWGIHIKYLLHGLEPTNSNACKRDVVLHSWSAIPDEYNRKRPRSAPQGYGCPAVSDKYMKHLDEVLKDRKRVLLWIYR